MTIQKFAIGLVVVALFVGSMTAHAATFNAGHEAYQSGDYAMALQIMRELADQGDAVAQFNLGAMYRKGEGVPQDYAAAVEWYRKAADQGNVAAQHNLGNLYHFGNGVAQDYSAALRWYRKAADQGDADAQFNIGLMYDNGRGVTQDYVQAHMWYNLAAARSDKMAKESRDILAKQMTPAQIAEAQKLAREWKPKGSEN